MKYQWIHVHAVVAYDDAGNVIDPKYGSFNHKTEFEQFDPEVNTPMQIYAWGVYGVKPNGRLEHIADAYTKENAQRVANGLAMLWGLEVESV